jgi:hypothetical protein
MLVQALTEYADNYLAARNLKAGNISECDAAHNYEDTR